MNGDLVASRTDEGKAYVSGKILSAAFGIPVGIGDIRIRQFAENHGIDLSYDKATDSAWLGTKGGTVIALNSPYAVGLAGHEAIAIIDNNNKVDYFSLAPTGLTHWTYTVDDRSDSSITQLIKDINNDRINIENRTTYDTTNWVRFDYLANSNINNMINYAKTHGNVYGPIAYSCLTYVQATLRAGGIEVPDGAIPNDWHFVVGLTR